MRQLLMLLVTSTLLFSGSTPTTAQPPGPAVLQPLPASSREEWRRYAGNIRGENYSPLNEINESNFAELELAWEWTPLDDYPATFSRQHAPPLMIDGALYFTTPLSQGVAIDAATGETLWVYNPPSYQDAPTTSNLWSPPGVAYWTDDEGNERLFWGTRDGYLICVGPKTGRPCLGFSSQDTRLADILAGPLSRTSAERRASLGPLPLGPLPLGFTSSPIVVNDTVLLGLPTSGGTPDALLVGAWDVYTGASQWTYSADTQQRDLPTPVSPLLPVADDDRGIVYLPMSADIYYNQGDTPSSAPLVAFNVNTGAPQWSFPGVDARLGGYHFRSHPNLVDITVNGSLIPAIAQVTSRGTVHVLHRETGAPIWSRESLAVDAPVNAFATLRPGTRPTSSLALDAPVNAFATLRPGTRPTSSLAAAVDPDTGLLYVTSYEESQLTAIDLNTGESIWLVGTGDPPTAPVTFAFDRADSLQRAGANCTPGPLVTQALLFSCATSGGASNGARLVAYDKRTGAEIGGLDLPRPAITPPMTYMLDRQYIAVAVDPNRLVSYALRTAIPSRVGVALTGWDGDQDGVRDDVQSAIGRLYEDPDIRTVLANGARSYQQAILASRTPGDSDDAAASEAIARFLWCLNEYSGLNSWEDLATLRALVLNTEARRVAYREFDTDPRGLIRRVVSSTRQECTR